MPEGAKILNRRRRYVRARTIQRRVRANQAKGGSRARGGDDGGIWRLSRSSASNAAGGSECERIACDGDGDVGRPRSCSRREVEGIW